MQDWQVRRSFDSEQGEVRWDVVGDGPPLVLVHGTPFSSAVWRPVRDALARRFTVYVWDLAGYGASAKFDGQDVSLAAQARILAGLLDHWGLDRPAVVGHDFGGAIALRALLLEHRAIHRLVLADAVAVAPWGTGFFRLAKTHGDVLQQLPDPVHDGLVRGYVAWAAHDPLPDRVVAEFARPWAGEVGKAALYRQVAQNGQHLTDEIQPRYGEIDVPTLVLWGEEDEWLPLEHGRELARLIPAAELRTFAGAGHLVQYDAPAAFAAEIIEFCSAM